MLRLVASLALPLAAAQTLDVTVAPTGMFTVTLDGKTWLAGAETMAGGASAAKGDLVPIGAPTATSGTDVLGAFKATTLKWAKKGTTKILMEAAFKQYPADPAMVVFDQHFPEEMINQEVLQSSLVSGCVSLSLSRSR